ncbi:MAG: hypothetical protein ACRDJC_11020 [Thermomicrobiales bacterium]
MTLKHLIIRMATIGLLVGLTGLMPGAPAAAVAGPAGPFTMESVTSPAADVAQYTIGFQEMAPVRHVLPPLPPVTGLLGGKVAADELDPIPGNTYSSLGSATVSAAGLEQVLTLARVTVAPGGTLRLAMPGGSGLVLVESGWLEVTERGDAMMLVRAPGKGLSELAVPGAITIDAGDRFSFGPEATIVLHNRGERPASVLTASVVAAPGTTM